MMKSTRNHHLSGGDVRIHNEAHAHPYGHRE